MNIFVVETSAFNYYAKRIMPAFNRGRNLEKEGDYQGAIEQFHICKRALAGARQYDSDLSEIIEKDIEFCEDMISRLNP